MYLYTVISFDIPLIKYILEYGRNKVEGGGGIAQHWKTSRVKFYVNWMRNLVVKDMESD